MKVLFIPQLGSEEPWRADLAAALEDCAELLTLRFDEPLADQLHGVDVVVDQGGHGTLEVIEVAGAAGIKLWQVLGTGLDHTPVDAILATGMPLANTPGQFSAAALAEHALFLMLCLTKRLREAERNIRGGVCYAPMNGELAGQTLGLVGLGASGHELARRASALGMTVLAVEAATMDTAVLAAAGVSWCGSPEDLPRLLASADIVSVHVPLTPQTRLLLDRDRLALMKPTAMLINVARGEIVDQDALEEALRSGRLAGVGLDVFATEPLEPDSPLLRLDNVIATPHVAGMTYGTSRRRAAACAENIRRISAGMDPLYRVTATP